MRKVTYFNAGVVADFSIPDDRFKAFSEAIGFEKAHVEDELLKAREVLGIFMADGDVTEKIAGSEHILAACYVWNFFNTNPEDEMHIEGDIIIIDLEGNGEHIDYSAAADINIAPVN